MGTDARRPLAIVEYDLAWPARFLAVATALRDRLGPAALRIDHIGSTAVPGLAAKDVIDIQVTVSHLDDADEWPDELVPGLTRRRGATQDHLPPQASTDPREWSKHYWAARDSVHVHVRENGRSNQRYPLLSRDFLRADALAASAYARLKRELVEAVGDDREAFYAIKDPACDLIIAGAERWADVVAWRPGSSDA